jgi:hypothetical protein
MAVAPAGGMLFTGYRGGPWTPVSDDYTLSNTGMVGYGWQVTGTPTWLTPSITTGQVFDTNVNVNFATNANTNTRVFGVYSQNLTFENCYSGATIVRNARLEVSENEPPTSILLELGRIDAGNVNSLLTSGDGNVLRVCRFLVPNQQVAPITFRVNATLSGTSPLGALRFLVRSRMVDAGSFSQTLDMFNWVTNAFDLTDVATAGLNTTFSYRSVIGTGALSRYLSGTRQMTGRIRVRQTGPAAVVNWCGEFDHAYFQCNP